MVNTPQHAFAFSSIRIVKIYQYYLIAIVISSTAQVESAQVESARVWMGRLKLLLACLTLQLASVYIIPTLSNLIFFSNKKISYLFIVLFLIEKELEKDKLF